MSLRFTQKLRYASGNYGKSLMWSALELFLLFYLTDMLGIPPGIAGMVVFLSLAWDGITDPLIGYLVDRQVIRGGSYKPFLIAGPPLTALAFVAIFIDPPGDLTVRIAYVLSVNLLFRTFYTLFDVPHNAMLARITLDGRERTSLAGMRILFSSLGSVTVALGIGPVLLGETAADEAGRFLNFAVITAALSGLVLWQSMKIHDQVPQPTMANAEPLAVGVFFKDILSNRDMRFVLLLGIWISFTLPVFAKLLSYFAKYNLAREDWVSLLLLILMFGQVVGIPLWTWLAAGVAKARAAQFAHLIVLGVTTLMLFASLGMLMLPVLFLAGIGFGGVYMLLWAISPDAVESLELQRGRRLEAGYFAFITMTQKVAAGAGAWVVGYLLERSGFIASQSLSAESLVTIKTLMCVMPGVGALVAIIALQRYRIDHLHHRDLLRRLGRN